MNRDDIIRMAREVGAGEPESLYGRTDYFAMTEYELERFATLIASAEREACAKVCDQFDANNPYIGQAKACASAMRARGNK